MALFTRQTDDLKKQLDQSKSLIQGKRVELNQVENTLNETKT